MFFDEYWADDGNTFFDDELGQPYFGITDIEVKNTYFDSIEVVKESFDDDTWDGSEDRMWDLNTMFLAKYESTVAAGSINFLVSETSELRIKRRVEGTWEWLTIHAIPIFEAQDFDFEFMDYLVASNKTYEYCFVPLINGEEGIPQIFKVDTKFSDYFILDQYQVYHAVINSESTLTYNQETATQTTIGRKMPFVIKNGLQGYYSGELTASFVKENHCEWDWEHGVEYRMQLDEFLTDGNPKILKDWLGHMFMVSIVESIPRNNGEHYYIPEHQINWVQIGDVDSSEDLYNNGFINTDADL